MKKRMTLLFSFICLVGVQQTNAHEAEGVVNTLFNQAVQAESVPGISVAVADNKRGIWANGFGYADLENRLLMKANTKLRIGSIAKVFTAAALMRLYQQGQIDFDADIRERVPQWPDKHEKITLSDLVSHTSGIRHYQSFDEFLSNVEYENTLDALSIFKDDALLFSPGSQVSYSTYGWTLISAVMEKAANDKVFKQIIKDEVLTPLDMLHTDFDDNGPIISHRQRAYSYENRQLVNSPQVNSSYKYAGGGFLSTPTDVVKFAMAHVNRTFLTSESLALLFDEKTLPDGSHTGIGIGWFIGFEPYVTSMTGLQNKRHSKGILTKEEKQKTNDLIRIMQQHPHSVMHSGGSVGGESMMILCLEHEHAVAVAKNVDNSPEADTFSLALRALDAFYRF
ncbi:serine hydrolase domain-containing protein [Shewanella surugensis]|uniref:Beta-lactamase family protein n=1 Tax=Shewanella surugensis TaxID=212020 RepID=A0ABT0LK97_9GAMM|nr:serine hydrolase domain-containing protein [Shewanella surugensis]MCL1127566.1 beta-lactamase family protein [Shewanella surugensis]